MSDWHSNSNCSGFTKLIALVSSIWTTLPFLSFFFPQQQDVLVASRFQVQVVRSRSLFAMRHVHLPSCVVLNTFLLPISPLTLVVIFTFLFSSYNPTLDLCIAILSSINPTTLSPRSHYPLCNRMTVHPDSLATKPWPTSHNAQVTLLSSMSNLTCLEVGCLQISLFTPRY